MLRGIIMSTPWLSTMANSIQINIIFILKLIYLTPQMHWSLWAATHHGHRNCLTVSWSVPENRIINECLLWWYTRQAPTPGLSFSCSFGENGHINGWSQPSVGFNHSPRSPPPHKSWIRHCQGTFAVADLHSKILDAPHPPSNFLHFHTIFGRPLSGWCPSLWKSWIRLWFLLHTNNDELIRVIQISY